MATLNIPRFSNELESFVAKVMECDSWRNLPRFDIDGGLGVAMVKSVLNGCESNLEALSDQLNIDIELLEIPYARLDRNGYFYRKGAIRNDKGLVCDSKTAWGFVAGTASGLVGARIK